MSTMKVDSIVSSGGTNTAQINGALAVNTTSLRTELNASGSAPIYACRAWVNFNGTGTVAIRASGNVTSITDNGTGDYTVNFTTAMPDANYAVNLSNTVTAGYASLVVGNIAANRTGAVVQAPTASNIRVSFVNPTTGAAFDIEYVSISVFR